MTSADGNVYGTIVKYPIAGPKDSRRFKKQNKKTIFFAMFYEVFQRTIRFGKLD